jgi:hypothetical protein
MLPRDISLEHAVLDLVDNSVDGAIRLRVNEIQLAADTPYEGLYCKLTISENTFEISDNCGGIPSNRIDAALRLGRDDVELDNDKPTIGVYGIGMKRSIFKIAADATVESFSDTASIQVRYDAEWLNPSNPSWILKIEEDVPTPGKRGVTITANELRPSISRAFGSKAFIDDLIKDLSRYYAYIMEKGFSIYVNEQIIAPFPIEFRFSDSVAPFYFESRVGQVSIKVIIGLFRKLTKEDEREEAISATETLEAGVMRAGITVVCNDRVIKYSDTTAVTGWGVGNVPRYHPQFRSIAGIIVFESDDARSLPVSTTKGSLDIDEDVYVHAKNASMEGLRFFTQYTNRVKGIEYTTDQTIGSAKRYSIAQVTDALSPTLRAVRNSGGSAKKSQARVPEPTLHEPMGRIAFSRESSEISAVAESLGMVTDEKPGVVGEQVWILTARRLGIIK